MCCGWRVMTITVHLVCFVRPNLLRPANVEYPTHDQQRRRHGSNFPYFFLAGAMSNRKDRDDANEWEHWNQTQNATMTWNRQCWHSDSRESFAGTTTAKHLWLISFHSIHCLHPENIKVIVNLSDWSPQFVWHRPQGRMNRWKTFCHISFKIEIPSFVRFRCEIESQWT